MKVLVADDDVLLHRLIETQLAGAGYEFVFASDGLEAWELLRREFIPMALVDWLMPGLDGEELVRRIRDAGWPRYTYLIMLTARDRRDDVVEGLSLGADDYVTKPFDREELLARMGVGARILQLEARLAESLAREESLATRDPLTGLPNRRALTEIARVELSRASRARTNVGLILVDLDHLKRINDEHGHASGDEALRRVAEVLRRNKRDYDYAGRWAGDEFVVILPGTSLTQAEIVAERIRSSIQEIVLDFGDAGRVPLSASVGVACAPPARPSIELEVLVQQADAALYRAKLDGRNLVRLHELAEGA